MLNVGCKRVCCLGMGSRALSTLAATHPRQDSPPREGLPLMAALPLKEALLPKEALPLSEALPVRSQVCEAPCSGGWDNAATQSATSCPKVPITGMPRAGMLGIT